ncbi:MAG: phosphomannomutase, partial [Thermodesulfobacteriota bacterium]
MQVAVPACFKAYDIRGRVPDELNPQLAHDIGRAFAAVLKPRRVAVGHDIRLSSPDLVAALAEGLRKSGVDVLHLGLCGTEEIYHAAFSLEDQGVDGGIVVTASHNPADYNGMKFVSKGARPVSGESGLMEMAELIVKGELPPVAKNMGMESHVEGKGPYIQHLLD